MPNGTSHLKKLAGYRSLFDALYPPLCLFANKYLNDMDTSKDIVQEVFIKIWEKQPAFTHLNTTKAYFYTTVKNHCLNYLKSKHYKTIANANPLDLTMQQSEEYFYSEIVTAETYNQLYKAINTLPKKSAKVITLSLNKYTTNEIAEELNITPSTVRTQKSLAYQKLKGLLAPLKYLFSFFP
ncbi:RNA polymerase sigma-70 factor, Bacteroides expansion family 1 [Aequorivita sublithincola DSM 14238]|uniref:RNA polymerase sigma-70 factor, Bacteroides expansion family 1 n=1 Tax=Aequorivita sublithincola (strain DSM 14238 / LMG 21431 / ACAM 643 / 9-3) TaxID=746697 RepID=I3YRV9_AEQSU|nr:RNA polymerase sigma-70 factor [Aequorivita sublithincola]AFL79727.1 RNA polymerase sigma-70 factor, Bacteroides expansion family 1 [Aequorivita sublithincola DSM 14238]